MRGIHRHQKRYSAKLPTFLLLFSEGVVDRLKVIFNQVYEMIWNIQFQHCPEFSKKEKEKEKKETHHNAVNHSWYIARVHSLSTSSDSTTAFITLNNSLWIPK